MAASDKAATKTARGSILASEDWKPRNLGAAKAINSIPTIATTTPVTSGGNRTRNRCTSRDKIASNNPEIAVKPNSSGRPPSLPAKMDAVM
jgi:hypothetical protein